MSSFLVTGAAGFIGAALAKVLLEEGHEVVAIDNLTTGYRENLPVGVEFYFGHCQDTAFIAQLPQKSYAGIFHFAGQSSGEISFDNPIYDLETNTASTLNLLQFALNVGCQRFIYASSMSVYGDCLDGPVKETAPLSPKSFYAVGKLASEHYLRLYSQYGIQSTALRFFSVYGPGQNLANLRQGMVSIYLAQMLANQSIQVKGDKHRFRDFIYIEDVVSACLACLQKESTHGKIINIATGQKTTVENLLAQLTALYAKPVTIEYKGKTAGDTFGVYADMTLAEELMQFKPQYDLATGLGKMLTWAEDKELNLCA